LKLREINNIFWKLIFSLVMAMILAGSGIALCLPIIHTIITNTAEYGKEATVSQVVPLILLALPSIFLFRFAWYPVQHIYKILTDTDYRKKESI
jgi:hypothetical protein